MIFTNKTKNRIFYTGVVLLLISFLAFAKYSRLILKESHLVTNGFIDGVRIVGRERFVRVDYHYFIDGRKYSANSSFNPNQMSYENFRLLKKKKIPVVYHKGAIRTISFPLIFPGDYEDFNVPFPDSLKWILPLIRSDLPSGAGMRLSRRSVACLCPSTQRCNLYL